MSPDASLHGDSESSRAEHVRIQYLHLNAPIPTTYDVKSLLVRPKTLGKERISSRTREMQVRKTGRRIDSWMSEGLRLGESRTVSP